MSSSSVPGLMLGKRHIADVNQNIAEPHAAIIAPVSMNDLIITPNGSGWIAIILLIRTITWSCPSLALLDVRLGGNRFISARGMPCRVENCWSSGAIKIFYMPFTAN